MERWFVMGGNQTHPRDCQRLMVESRLSQMFCIRLYSAAHIFDGDLQRRLVNVKPGQTQMIRMMKAGRWERARTKLSQKLGVAQAG